MGTKRLALLCLCVIVSIVACSGSSSVTRSSGTAAPSSRAPAATPARPTAAGRTAAAAVTMYYQAITGQDYRRAFTYVAADATGPGGRRLTLQAFLQLAASLDGMGGPVTHFSVAVFRSAAVLTLDRTRVGPYHAHLAMARHGSGWTIVSIDRI